MSWYCLIIIVSHDRSQRQFTQGSMVNKLLLSYNGNYQLQLELPFFNLFSMQKSNLLLFMYKFQVYKPRAHAVSTDTTLSWYEVTQYHSSRGQMKPTICGLSHVLSNRFIWIDYKKLIFCQSIMKVLWSPLT